MDEVEKRLRETSDTCFASYETWRKDQKNQGARETLQEAIHELRKVASRLEIELAVSERNEMAQKPIPIPPHRDARQRAQGHDGDADFNEDSFNQNQNYQQRGPRPNHQQGGGGHSGGGGGHRRRLGRRSEGSGTPPHGGGGGDHQG